MRKIKFVNDYFYHIYNRGIDKRIVFSGIGEYKRFLNCLSEFNTDRPARLDRMSINLANTDNSGQRLVDIVCFSLMPNHYHLLLKQKVENGITEFMHKLGTGYTMFFNKIYERSGRLFESSFKAKIIETDGYLLHLSRYIHLNCLDLIEPDWREKGIQDKPRAKQFLDNYRWSSYKVYQTTENSSFVVTEFLQRVIKEQIGNYEEFLLSWTQKDSSRILSLVIE